VSFDDRVVSSYGRSVSSYGDTVRSDRYRISYVTYLKSMLIGSIIYHSGSRLKDLLSKDGKSFLFLCYLYIVKKAIKISSVFPKHLFWDMRIEHLDAQRDIDLIIPRALFATKPSTFEDDIRKLENIYTNDEIVSHLKATKEHISNKVCELVAERYHIPVFHRFSSPKKS
jgi:hypothetical protein